MLFYEKGKKIVPKDIYNLLDPIALAQFICGDGQIHQGGLLLCTDSFNLKEVVSILNVLIIRYNLMCSIREIKNSQYRIYIYKNSLNELRKFVLPYMNHTMHYKIIR